MDAEGRFTEASGAVSFVLHTFLDGEHELRVLFEGSVYDYGNSLVSEFNAEEYGVVPAEGTYIPLDETVGDVTDPQIYQKVISAAQNALKVAGYGQIEGEGMTVWMNTPYQYAVSARDADESLLTVLLDEDMQLLYLQNSTNSAFFFDYSDSFNVSDDENTRKEIIEELQNFLREMRPDLEERFQNPRFDWGYEDEDGLSVYMLESWPISDHEKGIEFIVQVSPEWKIVYFSNISNG